ncbi:MAG: RNA polymerase sigma-70 factor [Flavobacteriaceae bacterium]|nr:RNA polymerase sigma-70 factor [Flavobacteriaceae bacterium]
MSNQSENICNAETFNKLFQTYAKDLKRYIYFKTKDVDLTEDILQETFIKLWDHCDRVTYSKVKSYLYTVATNIFLNHVKHEKVKKVYQSNHVKGSTNETPEFVLLEKEFLEKIEKAIKDLPPLQREVFLLNRIEKKKYREIAEMLEISVKAVEKRMHLALIEIRQKIGNI